MSSHTEPTDDHGHGHGEGHHGDVDHAKAAEGAPTWTWVILIIPCLILLIWGGYSERARRLEIEKQQAAAARVKAIEAATTAPVQSVVQLPDRATPCTMDIRKVRDIYTDGEAVYMLPPGWSRERAILYPGKGHLVIEGGNIHAGKWEFWSEDPKKVVLIRIFEER